MLILDVGKIRYNKKFYKTIIYTTLVLNILSYGIFPKSQSKYKEEVDNEVVYTAKLYTEERKTEYITTTKEVTITDIKLVENDYRYVSDGGNAFFEYSIPDVDSKLDFANINSNITFDYTTTNASTKGSCSVVKQVTKNEKGIIWCKGNETNSFESYGITLSINAKDTYVNRSPYLVETVNVTIKGEKSYTLFTYINDYEAISEKLKDERRVVLNTPGDCTTFNKWLEDYDAYYAANALRWYNRYTGQSSTESFSEIDAIKKYVAMYGVNSSSCNLENLAIPGISREVVTDSTNNLKRYIYTIEDNFVGYAKTYTQSGNSKEMYFTTSDGRSFLGVTDNTKWQSIFREYLNKYYLNENPKEIADYVDILSVLQQVDDSNLPDGVLHSFKEGKVTLEPALLDYVYNNKYKAEGKVRTTILDTTGLSNDEYTRLKTKMYNTFIENLSVVYNGYFSQGTLDSFYYTNMDNATQKEIIRKFVQSEDKTETGIYIENLRDYQVLGNDNLWYYYNSRTFTVYIRRDANYVWFETLPLGHVDSAYPNHISYTFSEKPLIEGQTKNAEYMRRIEQLDAYYSQKDNHTYKHNNISENVMYRYDEVGNLIGYIHVHCIYNNGILDDVEYWVYNGNDFDQSIYQETVASNSIADDIDLSIIDKIDDKTNIADVGITNEAEFRGSVDIMDDTETKNSVSADSNLSGEDKEGISDDVIDSNDDLDEEKNILDGDSVKNKTPDALDKNQNKDENPDIPLDDSDATSVDTAVSSGSSVQQAGAETVPSPSTNNSIESINEIQIEIPPISTQ